MKLQQNRTALGVKETPWGQLPTYTDSMPLKQEARVDDVVKEATVETKVVLDILINADGSVVDARVAESTGDKAVAEAVRRKILSARYARNSDPGVTRFVIHQIQIVHPAQKRPASQANERGTF